MLLYNIVGRIYLTLIGANLIQNLYCMLYCVFSVYLIYVLFVIKFCVPFTSIVIKCLLTRRVNYV